MQIDTREATVTDGGKTVELGDIGEVVLRVVEAVAAGQDVKAPEDVPLPHFEEGDLFILRGWPFRLTRVNASSLVLRPLVPEGGHSARKLMRAMT